MKKCYLVFALLSLISYVQACYSEFNYRTSAGTMHYISNYSCNRVCHCVKNVNTHKVYPWHEGVTKLFSTTDCTGNYQTITGMVENAEWVNSVSFGPSGISQGPWGCPSDYPRA